MPSGNLVEQEGGGWGKLRITGTTFIIKIMRITCRAAWSFFLDQMFLSYLKRSWFVCCVRYVFPWLFSQMWLDTTNARLDWIGRLSGSDSNMTVICSTKYEHTFCREVCQRNPYSWGPTGGSLYVCLA